MINSRRQRSGFTLIELITALMIAATVAVIGVRYLRPSSELSRQTSCDLTRQVLQNDVQRYHEFTGTMPSAGLRELTAPQYAGPNLPTCPATGEAYTLSRTGVVACPTHESTRGR